MSSTEYIPCFQVIFHTFLQYGHAIHLEWKIQGLPTIWSEVTTVVDVCYQGIFGGIHTIRTQWGAIVINIEACIAQTTLERRPTSSYLVIIHCLATHVEQRIVVGTGKGAIAQCRRSHGLNQVLLHIIAIGERTLTNCFQCSRQYNGAMQAIATHKGTLADVLQTFVEVDGW